MSKRCPLTRDRIRDRERGACPDWLTMLGEIDNPGGDLVVPLVDAEQDRWTQEASVFTQAFAKLARRAREKAGLTGENFKPSVWKDQATGTLDGLQVQGWFVPGSPTDVHRFEDPNGFTPLNLVETCRLLNKSEQGRHLGDELKAECIQLVRNLYRGPRRPEQAGGSPLLVGEVVHATAAGLRAAGAIAEVRWGECWGQWPATRQWVKEVETEMEQKFRDTFVAHLRGLKIGDLYWVARSSRRLPEKEGLVLVMEGLGGQRNFRYGLDLYTTSVAVAWATAGRRGRWLFEPICAGVYAVAGGLLYLGVAGEAGGAVVIDERERYHPARSLRGSPAHPGGELAVGLHHSRSHKRHGRAFVAKVSRLLPAYIDKEIALGAGAFSLSLTAAGNLGAYFEGSVNLISAYAGAVILAAATGRPGAATDLKGAPWVEGNPLTKSGLLAWGHEKLRADIGTALLAAPKSKKRRAPPAAPEPTRGGH